MGSRVGCMVAADAGAGIAAVVCLGYPLKGMNGVLRDTTLLDVKFPTLFVQGSKDGMCPLDKLQEVRTKMVIVNELRTVDGGDHSLKVGAKQLKAAGETQASLERKVAKDIADFLAKSLA
eukprot:SM000003S11004  [mRNA]  locus=s3:254568:255407:- [translate_table: standard]